MKPRTQADTETGSASPIVQQPVGQAESLPSDYALVLVQLRDRIRTAQTSATVAVNRELVALYWDIGQMIADRQRAEGWGKSIVHRLAADLRQEFAGETGFSSQNLWYMRGFFLAWTRDVQDLQQLVGDFDGEHLPPVIAAIPWGHNIQLITKLKNPVERLWYAQKTIENGWSRAVLVHQIESDLYRRQGAAISNFRATLPAPQSDLAHQLLKDPYTLDFLMLSEDAQERDLEQALINRIQKFLLELGMGFAFLGRQYHLEVGGEDYYVDLLFYHTRLHCYVVIDLKVEKFKPEFAGKMQFYLSAVDDLIRHPDDQPSIGLIICKERNRVIAEYALRDMRKPIGVSEYVLTQQLPAELSEALPAVVDVSATIFPGTAMASCGLAKARAHD
ncbi:MAG: DUF1016 family protein [Bryobacteraceae bacterium]|nr:DUF1016 family protein [Bryobacteraceae bacterium]